MLQAVEVGLLQGLVDVEVRALAQRGRLGHGLRGVGARPAGQVVEAAFWPTGPVRAVDAAAAAPAAVAAGRLCVPGIVKDSVSTTPFGLRGVVVAVGSEERSDFSPRFSCLFFPPFVFSVGTAQLWVARRRSS